MKCSKSSLLNLQQMQQKYLIGTLFEEEEQNKKMNLATMKAKDPLGNTRWKGAFTGGFQAGYKNTCGSKDGWTPSTFVSSVFNRAEKKEKNIFDFMDKEDLGREAISENIGLSQKFAKTNSLSLEVTESIGQKILSKMRKQEAFNNAPEDPEQLEKLLEQYEQEQKMELAHYDFTLRGIQNYESVNCIPENIPDDDFIVAYEDLFRKVIRANVKEETEEEIIKRREENKIYFDFTKPLDEEPDYLKEIQELDEMAKPKKRKRNILNEQSLRDIFKFSSMFVLNLDQNKSRKPTEIPESYDPYHRIRNLKETEKSFIMGAEEKKKHRIHNVNQRSDVLGEGKLASKFKSSSLSTNNFVRGSQEDKSHEKIFEDEGKNTRYWDYVLELEGKKISAQSSHMSYEETEKEKQEFEKVYKTMKDKAKGQVSRVETTLKQSKKEACISRKTGTWKPERTLCKRFNLILPYKVQ